MAYSFYFTRKDHSVITLEEWAAIVENTEGMRLCGEDHVAVNPNTGEEIRIPRGKGDAEMCLPDEGRSPVLFFWRKGSGDIVFSAAAWEEGEGLRRRIRELAAALRAIIIGDGGEQYN
jgi:hypothetical protein